MQMAVPRKLRKLLEPLTFGWSTNGLPDGLRVEDFDVLQTKHFDSTSIKCLESMYWRALVAGNCEVNAKLGIAANLLNVYVGGWRVAVVHESDAGYVINWMQERNLKQVSTYALMHSDRIEVRAPIVPIRSIDGVAASVRSGATVSMPMKIPTNKSPRQSVKPESTGPVTFSAWPEWALDESFETNGYPTEREPKYWPVLEQLNTHAAGREIVGHLKPSGKRVGILVGGVRVGTLEEEDGEECIDKVRDAKGAATCLVSLYQARDGPWYISDVEIEVRFFF